MALVYYVTHGHDRDIKKYKYSLHQLSNMATLIIMYSQSSVIFMNNTKKSDETTFKMYQVLLQSWNLFT